MSEHYGDHIDWLKNLSERLAAANSEVVEAAEALRWFEQALNDYEINVMAQCSTAPGLTWARSPGKGGRWKLLYKSKDGGDMLPISNGSRVVRLAARNQIPELREALGEAVSVLEKKINVLRLHKRAGDF